MKNIKTLLLGVFVLSLSSCLKEGRMNTDPTFASNVVELANTGDNATTSGIQGYYSDLGSVAAGKSKTFNINVHRTGPGNATKDVVVTLGLSQASLNTYNTKNGKNLTIPPTSVISFPTSVTIKAGTNQTTVEGIVTVSPEFNFNAAYGVPLKITAVSTGETISGNYSDAIYSFGVRNIYDGAYTGTGTMVDAANSGITGRYPLNAGLVTSGANTVRLLDYAIGGIFHSILSGGSTSYYGSFGVEFTIDASNKITSVVNVYGQPASNGRSAELDPSGVNTWDPSSKTLKVKYWMNQPSVIAGHRVAFDEVYTYKGVR
ncbi:MAG: DUF1735 domain-containing protein [Chitinophagia bacterium]